MVKTSATATSFRQYQLLLFRPQISTPTRYFANALLEIPQSLSWLGYSGTAEALRDADLVYATRAVGCPLFRSWLFPLRLPSAERATKAVDIRIQLMSAARARVNSKLL